LVGGRRPRAGADDHARNVDPRTRRPSPERRRSTPYRGRAHRARAHRRTSAKGSAMDIRLKRAYEPASPSDGYRVLIDRLWPRGLSKKQAKLDEWEKELSPSTELRTWFGHQPSRFPEFRRRYINELRRKRSRLTELRRRAREGTLTLV